MTYRFLHTSDLHLGKAFGGFPEAVRNRLAEARHGAIARLAHAARQGGADTVLLAGDTFDAETPSPQTLRHALRAMADEADIQWLLLPGNHDSLAATELWRKIAADAPANLRAVLTPDPLHLSPEAWLLPAPCTQRRPGRDLTDAMDAVTPDGVLRLGLGHGAIADFSGEEDVAGIIPPDRAARSGLHYLALGDWHGQMQVTPSTWYSGTPEADSFKHPQAAGALLVTLDGPGAAAKVQRVDTGSFRWLAPQIDLLPGCDPQAVLQDALPAAQGRRNHLIRLAATGRLALAERAALEESLSRTAPDFGWFASDLTRLLVEARPDDLDLIDRAGALRHAAEALLAEAQDPSLSQPDRDVAASALSRLYSYAQQTQP